MGVRWVEARVIVAGPSGRVLPVDAHLCEPDSSDPGLIVPIAIAAVLLVTAFVFPPCLLFNIPILLVRAALSQAQRASYDRVKVGSFDCPECSASNPPSEIGGALPLETTCAACKSKLEVRQAPRRNLVDEPTAT